MKDDKLMPAQSQSPEAPARAIKFPEIDPERPAGVQIFVALQTMILSMELPPGQALPEADIGARFGASRTPVREALQQLRQSGLVTTRPSRGHFVTKLNTGKILEARFLREALEVATVGRLCEAGLPNRFATLLKDNLKQQKKAIKKRTTAEFRHLDDEFHLSLARATLFPRIAVVLSREKMLLDRLRVLALRSKSHQKQLLSEHHSMLDAIIAKDKTTAVNITRIHLSSVLDTLSDLAAMHKEYFDHDAVTMEHS
uniref:GntR family transcriptional regulator n=1 Tax=Pararhizobium sp. IMCC3301 TaxID=3067904 RepID=UPI0027421819|nr:GntR family transcriptional regulator [Pararhizobium sp. IMCC3301]